MGCRGAAAGYAGPWRGWGIWRHPPTSDCKMRCGRARLVWLDDTGWRVAARPQNLRVLLSEQVTVYVIEPHPGMRRRRRFSERITPVFWCMTGRAVSTGLCRRFIKAVWSTSIRRCREMIQMASRSTHTNCSFCGQTVLILCVVYRSSDLLEHVQQTALAAGIADSASQSHHGPTGGVLVNNSFGRMTPVGIWHGPLAPDRLTISGRRPRESFRGETTVGPQLEQRAPQESELKAELALQGC
jgi:hypothetical protein